MRVLVVLGGILFFLFLLLWFPLRLECQFETEFSLTLRYLFFRFSLLPGNLEQAEEKEEKEKLPGEKDGSSIKALYLRLKAIVQQKGVAGFLQALLDFVLLLKASVFKILSHLKLKDFDLYYRVGGKEDAAAGALRYGQYAGAIYSLCGALFGVKRCRKKAVSVDLNFEEPEDKVYFSGRFSIKPLFLLREAFRLLKGLLPLAMLYLRAGKQQPENKKRLEKNIGTKEA